MVPQEQNNNEIFLQDRAHCMNAVAQIMEMRATGAVPLAYVQTYGCQQNVADGEKIKGQLAEMGFAFTENQICVRYKYFGGIYLCADM